MVFADVMFSVKPFQIETLQKDLQGKNDGAVCVAKTSIYLHLFSQDLRKGTLPSPPPSVIVFAVVVVVVVFFLLCAAQ